MRKVALFSIFCISVLSCKEGDISLELDREFAEDVNREFALPDFKDFSELQEWIFANVDPKSLSQTSINRGDAYFQLLNTRLEFNIVQCFETEFETIRGPLNVKFIIANNERALNIFEPSDDIDLIYLVTAVDVFASGSYPSNRRISVILDDNVEGFSIQVESNDIDFSIRANEFKASFNGAAADVFFDDGDFTFLSGGSVSGQVSCF